MAVSSGDRQHLPASITVRDHLKDRRPLLIAGGCGLNCDWNTKWLNSGLFNDVFVPPCADDSGIAIGLAVDAQRHLTGNANIDWTVYSGESFQHDCCFPDEFECSQIDYDKIAGILLAGTVVAWVQGRYEIGPRALGNRSLLAAPFSPVTKAQLNRIKRREAYRPVAPVCLEEETPQPGLNGRAAVPGCFTFRKSGRRSFARSHTRTAARGCRRSMQGKTRSCTFCYVPLHA